MFLVDPAGSTKVYIFNKSFFARKNYFQSSSGKEFKMKLSCGHKITSRCLATKLIFSLQSDQIG